MEQLSQLLLMDHRSARVRYKGSPLQYIMYRLEHVLNGSGLA